MILVAPTEPPSLKALGEVHRLPELLGVDFLFAHDRKLVGLQRKEFSDFIASLHDGRLAKESTQMQRLHAAAIIIEGRPSWTRDGELIGYHQFTREQYRRLLVSIQASHIWVFQTENLAETIDQIYDIEAWMLKPQHRALLARPNPSGSWGKPNSREWSLHLLQSFPGISVTLAGRILDHFGRIPMSWTASYHDFLSVDGIGPKKAKALWEGLSV